MRTRAGLPSPSPATLAPPRPVATLGGAGCGRQPSSGTPPGTALHRLMETKERQGKQTIGADGKLVDSPDKQPGFRWPVVVDQALDRLVEAANEAGAGTNRKELIAALVATNGRLSGERLGKMVRSYRIMTVKQALGKSEDGVVRLMHHGPGPRKKVSS